MSLSFAFPAALALIALAVPVATVADEFDAERRALIDDIAALANETARETGRPAFDARVMAVLAAVPRHRFVPPGEVRNAYRNRPLPIGYGQTISQPYIVALMTDLHAFEARRHACSRSAPAPATRRRSWPSSRETGLHDRDRRAARARGRRRACARWATLACATRVGDGYHGWEDCGPFDAIVVTAAASHVPPPLVRQLKPGGRMVIPVGPPFLTQQLMLVEKRADGSVATRQVLPVAFVPLTGRH